MRLSPRIGESRAGRAVVAAAIALYIGLVYRTTRWKRIGLAPALARLHAHEPAILAFWHGRLLMLPKAFPLAGRSAMMISGHRDGRILAAAFSHFGLAAVTGSSSRGSFSAFAESLRWLRRGGVIKITPDGPRGPRMRAQAGAAKLAQTAQVPIFPVAYATSRRRILSSWDRFHLPLPFGRGVYIIGEPIWIANKLAEGEFEAARRKLEDRMNQITAESDRLMGHPPIWPDATDQQP